MYTLEEWREAYDTARTYEWDEIDARERGGANAEALVELFDQFDKDEEKVWATVIACSRELPVWTSEAVLAMGQRFKPDATEAGPGEILVADSPDEPFVGGDVYVFARVYKTHDGIAITPGLRVFTTDAEWGTVDESQFRAGGSCDPGGKYFNGFFHVTRDSGRTGEYDGTRMSTTRTPGLG